jgi:hypothetical protein
MVEFQMQSEVTVYEVVKGLASHDCPRSHSRESGNPVRKQRISYGLRSGFPLSRE